MASVEADRGFVKAWAAALAIAGFGILVAVAAEASHLQAAGILIGTLGTGLVCASWLAEPRGSAKLPARVPLRTSGAVALVVAVPLSLFAFEIAPAPVAAGLGLLMAGATAILLHRTNGRR